MGLLDMGGAQPSQPQGGLLGALQGAQGPAPQGGSPELQMAMQLAATPTPQMAQKIIQQMRSSNMEGADQIAEILLQAGNDQQAIKQIADAAIQALNQ